MRFDLISVFPRMFDSYLKESILARAQKKRLVKIVAHNLRTYAIDKHKTVDDAPYGGGAGMVLKIEPIWRCVQFLRSKMCGVLGSSFIKSQSPYSQFYYDYKLIGTPEDYSEAISKVDSRKTVILEREPEHKKFEESPNNVKVKSSGDKLLEFETYTEKPAIFLVPISYYPGWKAKIDQQEAEIIGANINSQAIEIPAGKHTVKFEYFSTAYMVGITITLLSYLALLAVVLLPALKSFLNRSL